MAFLFSILSIVFYAALSILVLAIILALFAWSADSIDSAISCKIKYHKDGAKIKMRLGYRWAHYWAHKMSDDTYSVVFTETPNEVKSLLPCTYSKKKMTQTYFREYLVTYHKNLQVIEVLTNYNKQGG